MRVFRCFAVFWLVTQFSCVPRGMAEDLKAPRPLRMVSYNIRHGRGMDGRVDLARTARVLARLKPDLVALQEVDKICTRSGGVDIAKELGRRLKMHHAFGRFMEQRKVDLAKTLEFSSPIYRLELGMVGRLFAQDPHLYAEIIFSTPQRRQLLKSYAESLIENVELIEKADIDGFLDEFKRVAEWFGPFSDQAIRESTYLIEKMIERF